MSCRKRLLTLGVFTLWTLTSWLWHKLAKIALTIYPKDDTKSTTPFPFLSSSSVFPPLLVTIVQTITWFGFVEMRSGSEFRGLWYVTVVSHFLATLSTNCSFALTYASSTMAIKMLEPATSALLQSLVFHTDMGISSVVGMVVVVVGSVMYVGSLGEGDSELVRAVVLALLSNLNLGLRNVAIKASQTTMMRMRFHLVSVIYLYLTAVGGFLIILHISNSVLFSEATVTFLTFSFVSSLFHVTYSYVSTNLVLRYMSMVGHAFANILKRVLVVLLLYASERRSASLGNWLGLALCTVGLLLYNRKKLTESAKDVGTFFLDKSCHQAQEEADNKFTPTLTQRKERQMFYFLASLCIGFVVCVSVPTSMETVNTYTSDFVDNTHHHHHQTALRSLMSKNIDYVSEVIDTHPKPFRSRETSYLGKLRFGQINWTDGKPLLTLPVTYQPVRKSTREVQEFVSRESLLSTPYDTDVLLPYLNTSRAIISETQRVHSKLFRELFQGKKYAVLLELASHENKGDAALSVAEIKMLETMGIELLFYVDVQRCSEKYYKHALEIAQKHPMNEVVALLHGGGNIFGYPMSDVCREKALRNFRGYKVVMFSQSIFMHGSEQHVSFCCKLYCCNSNLTILLRDRLSLQIARRMFSGQTNLLLAPDMAFQIGHIDRFMPPYYDIIWQRRQDTEGPNYGKDVKDLFPPHLKVWVWDWLYMLSIKGDNRYRKAANVMANGLGILQKGRVVVTDRLHGHILSTLMDIPHVLLDNAQQKLSSYHNTWTRGLSNCRMTDNATTAARMAMDLLREYQDVLPKRARAADIKDFVP